LRLRAPFKLLIHFAQSRFVCTQGSSHYIKLSSTCCLHLFVCTRQINSRVTLLISVCIISFSIIIFLARPFLRMLYIVILNLRFLQRIDFRRRQVRLDTRSLMEMRAHQPSHNCFQPDRSHKALLHDVYKLDATFFLDSRKKFLLYANVYK
jgi:hypothetical protein